MPLKSMAPPMLSLNFKRLARFCLVAVMALFSAAPAQADHIQLFLLGGQSNMVGTGADTSGLPTALQSPQDDVLFYWKSDVGLTTLRPGSGINFGPEVTFGRAIADAFPAENFGLIKYASSGSDLVNAWDKDTGTVYANFRDTVADGLAALHRCRPHLSRSSACSGPRARATPASAAPPPNTKPT
jgi:hypothetical protein